MNMLVLSRNAVLMLLGASLAIDLCSCGTITPDQVKDSEASYDDSTPIQYEKKNSGFIHFLSDASGETSGAIITDNARAKYNRLISAYRIQFKTEYKISIVADLGVRPFKDSFGNNLWQISPQALDYFMRLNQWSKNRKDSDSVWMKLKDKL